MAKPRMDLSAFVGKLLEEQDGDVLRDSIRVLCTYYSYRWNRGWISAPMDFRQTAGSRSECEPIRLVCHPTSTSWPSDAVKMGRSLRRLGSPPTSS